MLLALATLTDSAYASIMPSLRQLVLPRLSATERAKLECCRQQTDQDLRVVVRGLLACTLHELEGAHPALTLASLCAEAGGRPYLKGSSRDISFSHAGDMAVCLVGPAQPLWPGIGVDIEHLVPLDPRDLRAVLSAAELAAISAAPDPARALFTRWTLQEATLKAHGHGFLPPDPRTPQTAMSDTLLTGRILPAPQGYALAVSAPQHVAVTRQHHWTLAEMETVLL